jgi:hypothetical protein
LSSILRELADLRRPRAAQAMSRRIGAQEDATARSLAAAVPTLLSAFARLAASPAAARSLLACLEGGRDGSVLADLPAALGSLPPARLEAILDQALGETRGAIEAQIARSAGIDPIQARAVLAASATLLLAALEHARRQGRWGADDLGRILAGELLLAEDAVPGSIGLLEELLEGAADAELGEEVVEVGARLLTRLCDS